MTGSSPVSTHEAAVEIALEPREALEHSTGWLPTGLLCPTSLTYLLMANCLPGTVSIIHLGNRHAPPSSDAPSNFHENVSSMRHRPRIFVWVFPPRSRHDCTNQSTHAVASKVISVYLSKGLERANRFFVNCQNHQPSLGKTSFIDRFGFSFHTAVKVYAVN